MTITDTTNSRTLTGYSAIQSVGMSSTSFPVIFTDTSNGAFDGTATVITEYVNSTGVTVYGQVEGTHPTLTLKVNGYYVTYAAANFVDNFPITLRWYYVQSTISPYNNLINIDLGTSIKKCTDSAWNNVTGVGASLLISNTSSGSRISNFPWYGNTYPSNNWHNVAAVTYNSTTGKYYKYSVTEITEGAVFDSIYKTSGLPYTYKLSYVKELTGWPTTTANL